MEQGHASAAQLNEMEQTIEKEIDAAVEFALNSPDPDISELQRDVFAVEARQ
jgi:pyruvate dehydrogenase E1 component alpha subunit